MFKAGDKVFSFRHGIVTLVEVEDAEFSKLDGRRLYERGN